MSDTPHIVIGGSIEGPELRLSAADCLALPASAQVPDVALLMPGKSGRGVRLAALFERARPSAQARFVHLASTDPGFAVSLPLSEVRDRALLVVGLDERKGGPFRLLVPGHPDECVHVKSLARIDLSSLPGRDTRPLDDAEHAKLHAKKK